MLAIVVYFCYCYLAAVSKEIVCPGTKITDLLLDELERYGIKGSVVDRSKHLAVVWQVGGRLRTVVTAKTPSDWRSGLNSRAELRRALREDDVQLPSPTSFNKAMSLPKEVRIAPEYREKQHHADVECLIDLVFELQEQLRSLENRMSSITVHSRIEFGTAAQSPQVSIQEAPPPPPLQFSESHSAASLLDASKIEKVKPGWTPRVGSLSYEALRHLSDIPVHVDDLAAHLNIKTRHAYTLTHKLHVTGLIVSPRRGWWKRV